MGWIGIVREPSSICFFFFEGNHHPSAADMPVSTLARSASIRLRQAGRPQAVRIMGLAVRSGPDNRPHKTFS